MPVIKSDIKTSTGLPDLKILLKNILPPLMYPCTSRRFESVLIVLFNIGIIDPTQSPLKELKYVGNDIAKAKDPVLLVMLHDIESLPVTLLWVISCL